MQKTSDLARNIRRMLFAFTAFSLLTAVVTALLLAEDPFAGLLRICTQSGQTVKSYFDASYGGVSGTFLNLFLVCLVMCGIWCLPGSKPDGTAVMSFFLTAGFCFWGMTILNIWFSFAGVALYALIKRKPLGSLAAALLFSTGLSPLITELLFRFPGQAWHGFTVGGVLLALAVGVFIGFLLPAGLEHSSVMHKGFDLYSAAAPMGFMAFFLRSLLYRVLTKEPPVSENVGLGDDRFLLAAAFCGTLFLAAIVYGLLTGGGSVYGRLLRSSGHNADFCTQFGFSAGVLNFGIYGVFLMLYYCAVGATWNAATVGITFCMVCTCCKGAHPLNVWPIMLGYAAASLLAGLLCRLTGTAFSMTLGSQVIVIGLCYACGLCPVSGKFGWFAGFLLAMAHYVLVSCVPLLHGGFLLYNGGFTAAIVCFLFVPVLEHFRKSPDLPHP